MTWIAFDKKTQNALTEISRATVMLEARSIDPLEYALASPRNSVVIVPMETEGEVALLTVRKNIRVEHAPAPAASEKTTRNVHYVSGGFLGLGDEFAEEEEPERKSWWKRLF